MDSFGTNSYGSVNWKWNYLGIVQECPWQRPGGYYMNHWTDLVLKSLKAWKYTFSANCLSEFFLSQTNPKFYRNSRSKPASVANWCNLSTETRLCDKFMSSINASSIDDINKGQEIWPEPNFPTATQQLIARIIPATPLKIIVFYTIFPIQGTRWKNKPGKAVGICPRFNNVILKAENSVS